MAGIGAFVGGDEKVINYLKFNVRSQIFAKSLPMALVLGMQKRLELLKNSPELRDDLWKIVRALQDGLKKEGFNIGNTQSPVTPVLFQGGTGEAANAAMDVRENYNIFCSVVIYPVVPKGVIMFRMIPTAVHSLADVEETIRVFAEVKKKLDDGVYRRHEIIAFDS